MAGLETMARTASIKNQAESAKPGSMKVHQVKDIDGLEDNCAG